MAGILDPKQLLPEINLLNKSIDEIVLSLKEFLEVAKQLNTQLKQNQTTTKQTNENIKNVAGSQSKLSVIEKERIKVQNAIITNQSKLSVLSEKNSKLLNKEADAKVKLSKARKQALIQAQKENGTYKKGGALFQTFTKSLLTATGIVGGFTMAIGLISKVFKQGTEAIRKYETGMANVLTLMSETERNALGGLLDEEAIKLVGDYGFEIEDVTKALFDAISAGVPAAESIDFLRKNAELAIGGVTNLGTSVKGTTAVINAFGLEFSETEKITSAFFAAQKTGVTTVEELSNNVGKAAQIAKQSGLDFNTLAASFAIITKQGISTDETATAIKATLAALINPADDARSKFEDLGIAVGASEVKQAGFVNVLTQIAAAAAEDEDALVELIPNIRALTGVGALGVEQLNEMDIVLKALNTDYGENSSLQQATAIQMETAARQAARLKGRWQELLITLGGGESIFKKIGSSFRTDLTEKLEQYTGAIKAFRVLWAKLWGKDIPDDTKEGIEKTGEIIDKNAEDTIETTESTENEVSEIQKKFTIQRAAIRAKTDKQKIEEGKKAAAKVAADKKASDEKEAAANKIKLQKELDEISDFQEKRIQLQSDLLLESEAVGEERVRLNEKVANKILELEIQKLEKQLELIDLDAETRKTIEQSIFDAKLELHEKELEELEEFNALKAEKQAESDEADLEAEKIKQDNLKQLREESRANIIETGNALFEFGQVLGDRELAKLEDQKKKGIITEEQYAKKVGKVKRRQAIIDKAQGLFNVAINTAQAITKIIATLPLPASLPFVIAAGALGAVQAATIAAKPIPKFRHGGKMKETGLAQYSEEGSELMKLPSGGMMLTPETQTIGFIPKGTEFIPHKETQRILAQNQAGIDDSRIINELVKTRKSLERRPQNNFNITSNGWKKTHKGTNNTIEYINDNFRK